MAPRKLRPIATLLGHSSWSLRCAISADGRYALSGDGVPSARIWDLEEPSNSREFASDLPLGIRQCALSDDGSLAAVAADGRGVSINEVSTGNRIFIIEEPIEERAQYSAGGCALTGDGSVLVAAFRTSNRSKGQLHIVRWKNPSAKPIILKRDYSIWQCEISSDARKVVFKYWKGSKSGVELIDINTAQSLGKWEVSNGEWNFAIDAEARTLVTADARSLRVIDMKTGDSRNMKSYTFSAFAGVDISANGKYVVAPMADYKFGIWEAETGRLIAVLGGHQNRSNGCAISADGTRVLTCSNDHTVRVWDTRGATSGIGADAVREALRMMLSGEKSAGRDHVLVRESVEECELGNAEELLQAHAALVIALRSAAAEHDLNERKLVQHSAEKVYATIEGKLHDKPDVQLGQVVMAHAEQRGLLSSGLPVQHMGTYYNLSEKSIGRLRENIDGAWKEVIPLAEKDNIDNIIQKHLNKLYISMNVGKEGIENGLFSNVAACVLLLWSRSKPRSLKSEYGKSKARSIKSMLAIGSPKDVAWIETVMPFDISSPRVLRYLLKRTSIEKLPPRRKHLIQKAVSNSRFQSLDKAESELTALIEKLARARGKFQSVLDIDIEDIAEVAESDDETPSKKEGLPSVRSSTIKSPLIQSRSRKFETQPEQEQEAIVKDSDGMNELLQVLQEIPKKVEKPDSDNAQIKLTDTMDIKDSTLASTPKLRASMSFTSIPSAEILPLKSDSDSRTKSPVSISTSRSIERTAKASGKNSNTLKQSSSTTGISGDAINEKLKTDIKKSREAEIMLQNLKSALEKSKVKPPTSAPIEQEKKSEPPLAQTQAPIVVPVVTESVRSGTTVSSEKEGNVAPQKVAVTQQLTELDRSSKIKTYVPEKVGGTAKKEEKIVKNVIQRLSISEEKKQILAESMEEIRLDIDDEQEDIVEVADKNRCITDSERRRSRTNVMLAIAAILAFALCSALLTLVILRTR